MENRQRGKRHIYLLHLWQERALRPGSPGVWRFSLEDPRTGQRQGFADLEGLVSFLRERMAEEPIADSRQLLAVSRERLAGSGGAGETGDKETRGQGTRQRGARGGKPAEPTLNQR